jgi:hypothetical protein
MMTRKQFVGSLAGMLGLATLGAACTKGMDEGEPGGGEGSGDPEGPDAGVSSGNPPDAAVPPDAMPPAMGCAVTSALISSNHGHVLSVSAADVMAGVDKTYNIKGTSTHSHSVKITGAMFATLKSTQTLKVMSTTDSSHSHSVTVTCPA